MAEVVTYRNDKKYCFCQLRLESGERILISIGSDSIRICQMILWGHVPIRTLWEARGPEDIKFLFHEESDFQKSPLDLLMERVRLCKDIEEVKGRLA